MIAIGSDHGGVIMKGIIKKYLDNKNIPYKDFGTESGVPADYPDISEIVCEKILSGEFGCGILVCGTGIGMSISANKVAGIRAAHVTDTFSARMAKEHNNAQIICLGERITGPEIAIEIVETYLAATFEGGRHKTRVDKMMELENK